LRGLAINSASTYQAENPTGFYKVGETKQLIIDRVVLSLFLSLFYDSNSLIID